MKNKPLTQEQIEAIRQMKRDGAKIPAITAVFGVQKSAILKHTSDIRSLWAEPPVDEETKATIRAMRKANLSFREIGERAGVSTKTAWKLAGDVKSSARRGKRKDPWIRKRYELIERLRSEGVTRAQLSERFGLTVNHIDVIVWKVRHEFDRTAIAERRIAA